MQSPRMQNAAAQRDAAGRKIRGDPDFGSWFLLSAVEEPGRIRRRGEGCWGRGDR